MGEAVKVTVNETPIKVSIKDNTPQVTVTNSATNKVTILNPTPKVSVKVTDLKKVTVNTGVGTFHDKSTLMTMLLDSLDETQLNSILTQDINNIRDLWARVGNQIILVDGDRLSIQQTAQTYTDQEIASIAMDISSTDNTVDAHYTEQKQTAQEVSSHATRLDVIDAAGGRLELAESSITQNADSITSTVSRLDALDDPLTGQVVLNTSNITQVNDRIDLEVLGTVSQNGQSISDHESRISISEDSVTTLVQTSGDHETRLSSAETTITDHSIQLAVQDDTLTSIQIMTLNKWGVMVTEDINGSSYATGFGIILYPVWIDGNAYVIDDYVSYGNATYKCILDNTADTTNAPNGVDGATYWVADPGQKSRFAVQADQFDIYTTNSHYSLFNVTGDAVTLGSDVALQSDTYGTPNVSSYRLDPKTGTASFVNMQINVASWNDVTSAAGDAPVANATIGATWGADLSGVPANLTAITGTEIIDNQQITINANGTLSGAGGGQVTANGVGAETPNGAQNKADAAEAAAKNYTDTNFVLQTTHTTDITTLQNQIDKNVTSWFYSGTPTLSNLPASAWATNVDKDTHLGDLYYDGLTGYSYRFQLANSVYSWVKLSDSDITLALQKAQTAQDTADHKRRVFVTTPVAPYDIGDLWDTGTSVKRSTVAQSAIYDPNDWIEIANYVTGTSQLTDDAGLGTTAVWANVGDPTGTKPADNADVTDYSDYRVTNSLTEANVTAIARPLGGSHSVNSSNVTGAIVILLPNSWTNTMMKFVVDVYLYTTGASFSLGVGGYNYIGESRWYKTFAQLTGSVASNNRVRFGHNGSVCAVVIGDTTSIWHYPIINIRDFQAGITNYSVSQWDAGWNVSIKTDLSAFTFSSDFADSLIDAKSIIGQGALATQNRSDLNFTDGADVTSQNTSLDTSNVNGTPASQVQANAENAITAVNNQSADGIFSVQEKAAWRVQWPGMLANHDQIITQANAYGLTNDTTIATFASAKQTLLDYLTAQGVWATTPTDTTISGDLLKTNTQNFYDKMQAAINKLTDYAHTAHGIADNADQTQGALQNGTTITSGGITVNGGSIKGGQTSYANGTGFFLGYEGGYKFSIGDGTQYLRYDGANLYINANVTFTNPANLTGQINADYTTTIRGGKITTNSLHANKIISNTITTDKIIANNITDIRVAENNSGLANFSADTIFCIVYNVQMPPGNTGIILTATASGMGVGGAAEIYGYITNETGAVLVSKSYFWGNGATTIFYMRHFFVADTGNHHYYLHFYSTVNTIVISSASLTVLGAKR